MEYHAIPRPLQSVQQWVQCRVYELMRVERGHREAVAVECAGLREQLVRAESELERLRMEREQLLRSKRGREAELTDEVRLLDTAKRRLMEEVTTLKLHTDALQVKGGAYDGLQSRLEQVEREHRELSQQSLLHASTVKSLLDEKDALVQRGRDNERKVELLTLDKLYLTTQLDAARDRLTLAERDRDRLQAQADDLRRHKEQMVEQLIRVRDEQKAGYDDRLTAELTRLQERTQADLEAIRGRQKEAYERDIHSLRETRDAVAVELTQLKAVSADSAQAFEQLRLEHAQLTLEVERERGEWRATLQARGFEYERLGLTTEEAMEELRGVKGELEGELRKNRLLRAEYERVQKEVEGMREKVGVYAALERELDLAIVGGGGGQEAKEAVVGEGAVKGIHRILEGVSDSLPLANRRRLQQSILLAQQLAERGRRVVALERELQAKGAEVERLQERVKQVEGWMEGVGQPQGYWVGMLRGKEEEVRGMRERVRQLEGQLGEAERGREEAVRVREEMEADVRRLMSQRTQLTHLRTALQQVRGGGKGGQCGGCGERDGGWVAWRGCGEVARADDSDDGVAGAFACGVELRVACAGGEGQAGPGAAAGGRCPATDVVPQAAAAVMPAYNVLACMSGRP